MKKALQINYNMQQILKNFMLLNQSCAEMFIKYLVT